MAVDNISGSSFENSRANSRTEDQSNPYFLQNGDSPGTILVSQVLIGNENYNTWSKSMTIALISKTKLGFVNGDILMPESTDILLNSWKRVNSMVVSWILNSVSKEIASSIIYIEYAYDMWNDLNERFYERNNPRVFQLKKSICELPQRSMTVNEYFTKLKTLWEEYCNYNLIPHCSNGKNCAALKMVLELQQKEYVMQFLMGLDDSYAGLRSQILMNDPLPTINKVFASVIQEERQRNICQNVSPVAEPVAFASKTNTSNNSQNFNSYKGGYKKDKYNKSSICTYCGLHGHVVDKCYRLHGFPPGFQFRNKSVAQGNGSSYGNSGHSGGYGTSVGSYGNSGNTGGYGNSVGTGYKNSGNFDNSVGTGYKNPSQAASVHGNFHQENQLPSFTDQGNLGNQIHHQSQLQNPQAPINYAQFQQLVSQYQQLMGKNISYPDVQFGANSNDNVNANACYAGSVPVHTPAQNYVQNLAD